MVEKTEFENWRKELVRQIREAGESLIKNAESIAGQETYLGGVDIHISCDSYDAPAIELYRKFYPERTIERAD